ncbi:MAG: hypothetical protein JHD16_00495 [Solirubrobacteraceae bacterium]|nr:hypothetical protein [Solirubrobacteraceae bacterium]
MQLDTVLTVHRPTLRIVATHHSSRSPAELEQLRGELPERVDIPDDVRDKLLHTTLASDVAAYLFLVREYVERSPDLPEWETAAWRSLVSRFAQVSWGARQPSIPEVVEFLSTIALCGRTAVDVARRVDGHKYVEDVGPGPILVNRLTLASPLDVALDLAPIWGTPTAVAALFYFVRFAFGADLDIRAHRENKRAEYLEATIRATELEVRHREMLESMAAEIRSPTNWAVERVEITDE